MNLKIKKLLEANKIKYKILGHRKVYTAFNAAETQHVDSKQIVKVVLAKLSRPSLHLLKDGKPASLDFIFIAVPAGKRVDLKKVAKAINDNQSRSYKIFIKSVPKIKKPSKIKAKIASEKDIEKKLKTKIGLLHPFSQLFGYPILVDKKLIQNKKLIVSAASYTESIEITTEDYLKLMEGLQGSFTE